MQNFKKMWSSNFLLKIYINTLNYDGCQDTCKCSFGIVPRTATDTLQLKMWSMTIFSIKGILMELGNTVLAVG